MVGVMQDDLGILLAKKGDAVWVLTSAVSFWNLPTFLNALSKDYRSLIPDISIPDTRLRGVKFRVYVAAGE